MTTQRRTFRRIRSEEGGGLVEYVLLISLIVIVCMASMSYFSGELNHDFSSIGSGLDVRP